MTMLWERLDQKTGGGKKLPRIKESEETVLRRYDADSDGHLDRDEFHGFARTYFSRVEWSSWRVACHGSHQGVRVLRRTEDAATTRDRDGKDGGGAHRQGQDSEGAGECGRRRCCGGRCGRSSTRSRPLAKTNNAEGKAILEEELMEMRAKARAKLVGYSQERRYLLRGRHRGRGSGMAVALLRVVTCFL